MARLVDDDTMRVPYQQILSDWSWLKTWLPYALAKTWVVTGPLALASAAVLTVALVPQLRRRITMRMTGAVLVPLAGLGYWFLSAPDIRFAAGSFLVLAMMSCAALVLVSRGTTLARPIAAALCLVGVLAGAKQSINMWRWWRSWPAEIVFGVLPSPPTAPLRTASGVELYVPVVAETCWAAPLPCTPYPSAMLDLNRPNDLSSGFRVSPFRDDVIVGWWTASQPWEQMKPGVRTPPGP